MITFLKILIVAAVLLPTLFSGFKVVQGDLVVKFGRLVFGGLVTALLFVLLSGVGFVPEGYRGVVTRFGAVTGRVIDPGIYLLTPVAESMTFMDVQTHALSSREKASSYDLQDVTTEITLNYTVDPQKVHEVFSHYRQDVVERMVVPAAKEAVKATTAKYTAEQLITKRATVRADIEQELATRLHPVGVQVSAISITDFTFSKSFTDAIEAKVTAVQQALQAENELVKIKTEAQQKIATAQAEAESIRIKAESIAKQGGQAYVELKRIEKWDGRLPSMVLGGDSQFLMQLPVPK